MRVKSLFCYKDEKGREHFLIRHGSEFERLVYKKYLVQVGGRRKTTNKSFVGQLSLYFQNCPSLQSKLSQVQYNNKSLIDIFQYYYGCADSTIEFQQNKENIQAESGIVAGLTSTKLNFYSNDYEYLVYADFARSTDLSDGLSLDLVLLRYHRKWSVYHELLFNSYKVIGEYETSSDYETTNTQTTIAYSYIKLNALLRYKFPVQNMFVYLNTGVSNGFAIKETKSKEKVRKAFSKVNIHNTTAINYSTMLEQGVIVGLGSQFKKCSFEARYEGGTRMSRTYG